MKTNINYNLGEVCEICGTRIKCRESEMPLSFPESMRKYPNIFYGCKCYEGSSKDEENAKKYYIMGMESYRKFNIKNELNSLKEKGEKTVTLNGWEESIDYILTLDTKSLVRIKEGVYLSEPIGVFN